MKKLYAIILLSLMVLGLVGCDMEIIKPKEKIEVDKLIELKLNEIDEAFKPITDRLDLIDEYFVVDVEDKILTALDKFLRDVIKPMEVLRSDLYNILFSANIKYTRYNTKTMDIEEVIDLANDLNDNITKLMKNISKEFKDDENFKHGKKLEKLLNSFIKKAEKLTKSGLRELTKIELDPDNKKPVEDTNPPTPSNPEPITEEKAMDLSDRIKYVLLEYIEIDNYAQSILSEGWELQDRALKFIGTEKFGEFQDLESEIYKYIAKVNKLIDNAIGHLKDAEIIKEAKDYFMKNLNSPIFFSHSDPDVRRRVDELYRVVANLGNDVEKAKYCLTESKKLYKEVMDKLR